MTSATRKLSVLARRARGADVRVNEMAERARNLRETLLQLEQETGLDLSAAVAALRAVAEPLSQACSLLLDAAEAIEAAGDLPPQHHWRADRTLPAWRDGGER